jgi:hypothetical protein
MSEKKLITCPHCAKSFSITWTTKTGSGEQAFQHSPGCMKTVWVKYSSGQIISIR